MCYVFFKYVLKTLEFIHLIKSSLQKEEKNHILYRGKRGKYQSIHTNPSIIRISDIRSSDPRPNHYSRTTPPKS